MERHTEYLPLHHLTEDPANPKKHDSELLGTSITRFGFIEPLVMDERTGYLVSGHGRLAHLQDLQAQGQQPPEGIQTDSQGQWLAPVIRGWASTSDTEAHAALAALNRVGEKGGWVETALLDLLEEVSESPEALQGIGFTDRDLTTLQRLAEAESIYTTGVESLVDEFRNVSGQEETSYTQSYETATTIYFKDTEAIEEFTTLLGLDKLPKRINYPLGWTPQDNRLHD